MTTPQPLSMLPGECACGWLLPAFKISLLEPETQNVSSPVKDPTVAVTMRCPSCGALYMFAMGEPRRPEAQSPAQKPSPKGLNAPSSADKKRV